MNVYQSKNGYFYKSYKNGKKKRISKLEYSKKLKNMKDGGRYNEKDIISIISNNTINLPLVEIKEYVNVGMGGLHESEIPIGTNGIATCMGIGTHIDSINYFSHASPFDYSGQTLLINEWKTLLENNIDDINSIYLYTPYGISKESLPFLIMLNNLELIDKTIHVTTTVFNNKKGNYTNEWNVNFKVGISEDGPWGYDYSVDNNNKDVINSYVENTGNNKIIYNDEETKCSKFKHSGKCRKKGCWWYYDTKKCVPHYGKLINRN